MRQKFFKFFADLRVAITLISILIVLSIIGTIIEQDQLLEVYKTNYPTLDPKFGFLSWTFIIKFGLNHLYSTWWYNSFIVLLALSLLTCTFLQQFPALKIAQRYQFLRNSRQFNLIKLSFLLKNSTFSKIFYKLKKNNYYIFQQKNSIYCYKGLIGRMAPIIVHLSIILVLFGGFISALSGFKAQEIIPKTELFHIQNLLTSEILTYVPKLTVRINDFWILYNKQTIISQFYSDLSFLDFKGNELKQTTIFVNYPMSFLGIDFYQTDWNLVAIRIGLNNFDIYQFPLIKLLNTTDKIWISWIPENEQLTNGIVLLINNLQGYSSIYNKLGVFLGNIELNELFQLKSNFFFIDILSSTGLQIKSDPAVFLIYLGFFFLICSTLLSYITYSQIWILLNNKNIIVSGKTTRATFNFEIEFLKLFKL